MSDLQIEDLLDLKDDDLCEDLLNIGFEVKNNTNEVLNAFNEDTIEEIINEMDHPEGKIVHTKVLDDHIENLDDVDEFIKSAKIKRDNNLS